MEVLLTQLEQPLASLDRVACLLDGSAQTKVEFILKWSFKEFCYGMRLA